MSDIRRLGGLSSAEARARLEREGPNEVPSSAHRGLLRLALDVLREPMILLLLGTGAIYFLLGDSRDAAVLLVSILAVIGISLVQSQRTERSLEKLRDLSSPRARVIRDSEQTRIAGREVVRGDLLILSEGDRVAADGTLRWLSNLSIDESLLTGESVPVPKTTAESEREAPADSATRVFSGTLVVSGQGVAEVTATGPSTEMGKIGRSLQTIAAEKSPLQLEIGRLVRRLGAAGLAVCALIVLFYSRSRGSLLEGLLAGLAAAMSILPEEFPVVLTVFLALGAWRISRQRVLTRRIAAIEALGATTVLCVDKTGTLTLNRMAVSRLASAGRDRSKPPKLGSLTEEFHELMEFAILASRRTPFDPTEQAIREFGLRTLARTERLHEDWELLKEYPLSAELLAVSHAWRARDREDLRDRGQGRPRSDRRPLPSRFRRNAAAPGSSRGARGGRSAGPRASRRRGFTPRTSRRARTTSPSRSSASWAWKTRCGRRRKAAVEDCRAAGIRVVMITGDYPVTAARVAREIGLTDASSDDRPRARRARRRRARRPASAGCPSSRGSSPRRSCGSSRRSRPSARSSS